MVKFEKDGVIISVGEGFTSPFLDNGWNKVETVAKAKDDAPKEEEVVAKKPGRKPKAQTE